MDPLSRLALESGVAELIEATLPSAGSGLAALCMEESGWRWLSRWQYTSSTDGNCSEQTGHLGVQQKTNKIQVALHINKNQWSENFKKQSSVVLVFAVGMLCFNMSEERSLV